MHKDVCLRMVTIAEMFVQRPHHSRAYNGGKKMETTSMLIKIETVKQIHISIE